MHTPEWGQVGIVLVETLWSDEEYLWRPGLDVLRVKLGVAEVKGVSVQVHAVQGSVQKELTAYGAFVHYGY